jgi:hypothetical protein
VRSAPLLQGSTPTEAPRVIEPRACPRPRHNAHNVPARRRPVSSFRHLLERNRPFPPARMQLTLQIGSFASLLLPSTCTPPFPFPSGGSASSLLPPHILPSLFVASMFILYLLHKTSKLSSANIIFLLINLKLKLRPKITPILALGCFPHAPQHMPPCTRMYLALEGK